MRRNLQAMWNRFAARELREELAGLDFGRGGWASLHAKTATPRPKRFVTQEEIERLTPVRPGTPDGGF